MKKGGRTYKSLLVGLGAFACLTVLTVGAWSGGLLDASAWGATGLAQGLPRTLTVGLPAGVLGFGGSAVVGAGLMRLWSARQFRRRLVERDRQLTTLREELAQYQGEAQQWQTEHQSLNQAHQQLQQQFQTLDQQQRQEQTAAKQSLAQMEQELAATQKRLESMTADHNRDLDEIQADVESTWDEYDQVCRERDALKASVAELREALADSQSNLDAVIKHQGQSSPDEECAPDAEAVSFATVSDALAAAKQDFGDVLEIWESAEESAAASQFGRPDEAYEALKAIAAVGRDSFASDGDSSGGWRNAFRQYGFDFKPTEHQVTKTMYGSDRDFRHQGRKQRMLKHITLGRNSVVHNLQIYFEPDRDRQKIDIGYCGKHLRCYGWDS